MSLMKWDTSEPLPPPSIPFHFQFSQNLNPLIFPSFSLKLIHLYLMKTDILDGTKP